MWQAISAGIRPLDVKNQLPEFDHSLTHPRAGDRPQGDQHGRRSELGPKVTCFSGSLGLASADPLHGPFVRGMEKLRGYTYFACCGPTTLNANLPPIAPADCYVGERS